MAAACMAVVMCGFLLACGNAPAPLAQGDPQHRIAIAQKAPPIRRIEIDKSAYPAPPPRQASARIVALLLPLGDARETIRSLAGHLYNGAQLALFDAATKNLVISLHDTRGTADGAQEAAKAAIAAGADIIVGPLFGSSVTAIQPVLAGRNVPGFAFSNDASTATDGLWLMGFLPEQNIDRIVSEAIAQGLTRSALWCRKGFSGHA